MKQTANVPMMTMTTAETAAQAAIIPKFSPIGSGVRVYGVADGVGNSAVCVLVSGAGDSERAR